jgi:hypothetical protein
MKLQSKKILNIVIKISVLLLAYWYIFKKLTDNQNISNFKLLLSSIALNNVLLVLFSVFILMLFNWFLESLKWKFLVKDIEKVFTIKGI